MALICFRCLKIRAVMAGVPCAECAREIIAKHEVDNPEAAKQAEVMKEADTWEEWRVRHYDFAVRHRPLDA